MQHKRAFFTHSMPRSCSVRTLPTSYWRASPPGQPPGAHLQWTHFQLERARDEQRRLSTRRLLLSTRANLRFTAVAACWALISLWVPPTWRRPFASLQEKRKRGWSDSMMHVEVEASPCHKMTTALMDDVISHWLSLHDHIVVKRARVWPSTRARRREGRTYAITLHSLYKRSVC